MVKKSLEALTSLNLIDLLGLERLKKYKKSSISFNYFYSLYNFDFHKLSTFFLFFGANQLLVVFQTTFFVFVSFIVKQLVVANFVK